MVRLLHRLWIGYCLVGATSTAMLFGQEPSPPVQESAPVQESEATESVDSQEHATPADDPAKAKVAADVSLPDDVRLAMEEFNNALQAGSRRHIGQKFSVSALFDSLVERQLISGNEEKLAECRKVLETGLRGQFRTFADLAWVRAKWLQFERLDEQRVVLLARHYDSEEPLQTVRWWLKREQDTWRVYDFEILDLNLRISTMLGIGFSFAENRPASFEAFQELAVKANALVSGMLEDEEIELLIESADEVLEDDYPDDIRRFGLLIRAVALAQLDEMSEALDDLKRLEKMPVESPILHGVRGDILAETERYEAAIESYVKLGDALGYDFSVHESIADAYLGLEDWENAEKHARLGLQDWPESVGCLASLAASLPSTKMEELEPFFREHDYDEETLATVIYWCLASERLAGARHTFELLKTHHKDSELIEDLRESLESAE